MAEANGEDENPYSKYRTYAGRSERRTGEDSDDNDENPVKPDLGIGNVPNVEKKTVAEAPGNEMPKREENPFSFRHFLKRDAGNSYQGTGARPKVYSNLASESFCHLTSESSDSDPGLYSRSTTPRHVGTPELTSVLPDFVQDHLVVEQCYLNHSDNCVAPQLAVDLDNLPDFAINSSISTGECSERRSHQWDESKRTLSQGLPSDIPFDLTEDQNLPRHVKNGSGTIPLDLPSFDNSAESTRSNLCGGGGGGGGVGVGGGLPFDLPLVSENKANACASSSAARNSLQLGEVGVSKSLPDFLSDGPIHSGRLSDIEHADDENTGGCTNSSISGSHSPEPQRLMAENDMLRRELEIARRQLNDQTRRVQSLEKELITMRSKEHEETATLEKAIEQVEDNLKRSTRRAVTAESQVSKLKQEIKVLLSEISALRKENHELHCGQAGASAVDPVNEQTQRVAQELRAAASTAEHSLRQLMSGVGNLRVLASTLENMHRFQDRTGDFLADLDGDEQDDTGPAL